MFLFCLFESMHDKTFCFPQLPLAGGFFEGTKKIFYTNSGPYKGRFFFRKNDAFFSLPKKCAKNYPLKEILELCCV